MSIAIAKQSWLSKAVKTGLSALPEDTQTSLKRIHFKKQIKNDKFVYREPEYLILDELIQDGDWAIDIGANVGHYTKRMSDIVGTNGRVIAFEPVPRTLSILSSNIQHYKHSNVTLMNAAVSNNFDVAGMSMPDFNTGLANYYEAHLDNNSSENLSVVTLPLDCLPITQRIALIKVDVEGHEHQALLGMEKLVNKFKPHLIVETGSEEIISLLASWGYEKTKYPGSPNILFKASN